MDLNIQIPDNTASIFEYLQKGLFISSNSTSEEVRDMYKIWRPTPLVRALGLEKVLDTPAHIYFKNESVSPVGSHKLNSAIPQAYYCKKQGITNITTETGAA